MTKEKWFLLLILIVGSATDLKWKRIPGWLILVSAAGGLCMVSVAGWERWDWILWGITGMIFLIFCRISNQAVGYGDGLIWSVTGLYLGVCDNLKLWMTALFFSLCFSAAALVFRRVNRKDALPFLPFLTAAHVLCLVSGY